MMDVDPESIYQPTPEVQKVSKRYLQAFRILLHLEIDVLNALIQAATTMERLADTTTPAYASENQQLIMIVAAHASHLKLNIQQQMNIHCRRLPSTPQQCEQYYHGTLRAVQLLIQTELHELKRDLANLS
jgi:hypothetical protein